MSCCFCIDTSCTLDHRRTQCQKEVLGLNPRPLRACLAGQHSTGHGLGCPVGQQDESDRCYTVFSCCLTQTRSSTSIPATASGMFHSDSPFSLALILPLTCNLHLPGRTPLHRAFYFGHLAVASRLLSAGASTEASDFRVRGSCRQLINFTRLHTLSDTINGLQSRRLVTFG